MHRVFRSTLAQIGAIIVGSMLATTLLIMGLVYLQNAQAGAPWPWAAAHRIVSLVNLLEGVPPEHVDKVTLLASAQRPNLVVSVRDSAVPCTGESFDDALLEAALRSELVRFPDLRAAACASDDLATNLQVLVPISGKMLEIRTGTEGRHFFRFGAPGFGALLFLFTSLVAMSIWAIWRVIHPLRRLSEKVEQFARDISPAPIAEEGPAEIRNVARTLNLMQERISGMIADRTRMLAAVSHDLRTPLTRMRLQLEAPQGVDVEKLARNIDLMQTMVTSTLSFLDNGDDGEEADWIDLDALLATLCDEYEESGADVRYEGPGHIRFHGRPLSLQRAVGNLLDNALHHGGSARVIARDTHDAIHIDVVDTGPGMPDDRLQDVLAPFVRLDASRNPQRGSIGLGLSIVDGIVQAHGGTLTLANGEGGGLVASIVLPRRA